MVEYEKYLKLPFNPESRKGFLIYLTLVEITTATGGLLEILLKKYGLAELTSKELIKLLSIGTIREILFYSGVAGIVTLILWIVMGMYVVGYLRNLLKNEDKLPGTEAFSIENLVLYIKAVIAMFLCILPSLILFSVGLFLKPLELIGLVLLIIGGVIAYVSYIRVIDTESLKEGLKFRTLFQIGFSRIFIVTLIVAVAFGIVLATPEILVGIAKKLKLISAEQWFVLRLLTTVLTTYAGLVTSAWIVKAYQERATSV